MSYPVNSENMSSDNSVVMQQLFCRLFCNMMTVEVIANWGSCIV